jgi:hypothetical protein
MPSHHASAHASKHQPAHPTLGDGNITIPTRLPPTRPSSARPQHFGQHLQVPGITVKRPSGHPHSSHHTSSEHPSGSSSHHPSGSHRSASQHPSGTHRPGNTHHASGFHRSGSSSSQQQQQHPSGSHRSGSSPFAGTALGNQVSAMGSSRSQSSARSGMPATMHGPSGWPMAAASRGSGSGGGSRQVTFESYEHVRVRYSEERR